MEKQGCDFLDQRKCDLYIAPMDENALPKAMQMAKQLREYGYWAEYDVVGRGLKAQLKYANKIGAAFTVVLGDDELSSGKIKLKNMEKGEELELSLDDKFTEHFDAICVDNMLGNIDSLINTDEL
jgi:histidyl-tRNA synthetase